MNTLLRGLVVTAILVATFAVDRGYLASLDRAEIDDVTLRGIPTQKALARVITVQAGVEAARDEGLPYNPVRGPRPDTHHPCAATLLTGGNRGRVITFLNTLHDRPDRSINLRPGDLVSLSVTTRGAHVVDVAVLRPPVRWRALLWAVGLLFAVIAAALGRAGVRAVVLAAGAGGVVMFIAVPLLAKGTPALLTILLSFAPFALLMLLIWGGGWRPALCASAATLAGLLIGALIAFAATHLMGLTGEASAFLRRLRAMSELSALDFRQLLAAGISIIAMGAALDTAAGVVAGLVEFRQANPAASPAQLRVVGFRINRDTAGTMVLTLFCAWLALRLPVLMIPLRLEEALGPRWIRCYAMEIVQIVSASIAVMCAGPLGAILFSVTLPKSQRPDGATTASDPRRRRSVENAVAAILFAAMLAASCVVLVRSRRAPAKSSFDVAALRTKSSAAELQTQAEDLNRLSNYDHAMLILWRARELTPDDPLVDRELSYAYMMRGWHRPAHAAMENVLPTLDSDARAHFIHGILALEDEDVDTARQSLQRALDLDPTLTRARDALSALSQTAPPDGLLDLR